MIRRECVKLSCLNFVVRNMVVREGEEVAFSHRLRYQYCGLFDVRNRRLWVMSNKKKRLSTPVLSCIYFTFFHFWPITKLSILSPVLLRSRTCLTSLRVFSAIPSFRSETLIRFKFSILCSGIKLSH